jgi:hypothetical protein
VVVIDIQLVPGLNEHDARAKPLGLADLGASADAKSFGFIACRDATGGIGQHGNDGDRAVAQLRS